jgi:hypothetical protein
MSAQEWLFPALTNGTVAAAAGVGIPAMAARVPPTVTRMAASARTVRLLPHPQRN